MLTNSDKENLSHVQTPFYQRSFMGLLKKKHSHLTISPAMLIVIPRLTANQLSHIKSISLNNPNTDDITEKNIKDIGKVLPKLQKLHLSSEAWAPFQIPHNALGLFSELFPELKVLNIANCNGVTEIREYPKTLTQINLSDMKNVTRIDIKEGVEYIFYNEIYGDDAEMYISFKDNVYTFSKIYDTVWGLGTQQQKQNGESYEVANEKIDNIINTYQTNRDNLYTFLPVENNEGWKTHLFMAIYRTRLENAANPKKPNDPDTVFYETVIMLNPTDLDGRGRWLLGGPIEIVKIPCDDKEQFQLVHFDNFHVNYDYFWNNRQKLNDNVWDKHKSGKDSFRVQLQQQDYEKLNKYEHLTVGPEYIENRVLEAIIHFKTLQK